MHAHTRRLFWRAHKHTYVWRDGPVTVLLMYAVVDLALQGNTMSLADPVDAVHDAHFPQNDNVDAEHAEDVAGMQQQQNRKDVAGMQQQQNSRNKR